MISKRRFHSRRGMAIVFAVLLVTVVLTVSLLLFSITLRQILLSLVARDSRFAFYAADSARNCVLYWDRDAGKDIYPFGRFVEDIRKSWILEEGSGHTPVCDGGPVVNFTRELTNNPVSYSYESKFVVFFKKVEEQNTTPCARVSVEKYFPKYPSRTTYQTKITISGYNLSDKDTNKCPGDWTDRVVERTIVTGY